MWHDNCPEGADSWCGYQRDKTNKTKFFKPRKGLLRDVSKYVKPIFVDLCNEELFKRCLDCKTQNQNESFNATVWNRLPKTTYVGFSQFQFGLYDAVAKEREGKHLLKYTEH